MNLKYIIPIILMIFLSSQVLAQVGPLTIRAIPIKTSVNSGESAYYTLEIINGLSTNEEFIIKTPELEWTLDTIPENNYFFTVYRDSVARINISVTPRMKLNPGFYRPILSIERFKTGEITRIGLDFNIKSNKTPEFLPSVRGTLEMPYEVDPREPLKMVLVIENLNPRELSDVKLSLKSKFFSLERTVFVYGNERKSEEFTIDLDPIETVGTDVIEIDISVPTSERIFTFESAKEYKVMNYAMLEQKEDTISSFLKTTYVIEASNNGNSRQLFEVPFKTSFPKSLFTSTEPKSDKLKTADGSFLIWKFELDPRESKTLKVTVNYLPLGIISILLIISVSLYYFLRPPIVAKKSIVQIHTTKEGGISEMKVVLHVKNRTKKVVDGIKIIEKIPFIVEVNKEFHIGTLKPTTISKATEQGSIIRWDIANLDSFEERIITYKIKTKLSILGGIKLPATVIKYRNSKNDEAKTLSNSVNLEI